MARYPEEHIECMTEVFRSPESYDERWGGRSEVAIPINPPSLLSSFEVSEGGALPSEYARFNYMILRRHKRSIHIGNELLDEYCPDLNFRGHNLREVNIHKAWIIALVRKTSEATYQQLKEETWDCTHNVVLDSVKVIWQTTTNRILIDMTSYACREIDIELVRQRFQQALMQLLQNSITLQGHTDNVRIEDRQLAPEDIAAAHRLMPQWGNINWDGGYTLGPIGKKYDDKAEERALKLIKEMLTSNEFKSYKDTGYVMIKGKSKKMYKVKKDGMIEVSKKDKDSWYKAYRLCIEPKHYGTICPTDEVIAKIKLIQADEKELHKVAKKFEDKISGYVQGSQHFL